MGPWLVVHGAWLVEQLLGLVACLLRVSRGWCNAGRHLQFTEKYALHSSVMQSLHLLTCKFLITHLSASNQQAIEDVSYSHLFGTVSQQLNITNIFLALLGIRKRLLQTDQEPACEGNSTRPED